MINIAGLNKNDFVNGEGVSVSLFLQGCHFHCPGCHNPESWDFEGGHPCDENKLINEIIEAITKNGIQRNLSILGGEPLDTVYKIKFIAHLIQAVKQQYPNIIICLWTGYYYKDLQAKNDDTINYILSQIDYLIEGPFILKERDITLKWRGSRNQRIINMKEGKNNNG